jgi:hypothetical protein
LDHGVEFAALLGVAYLKLKQDHNPGDGKGSRKLSWGKFLANDSQGNLEHEELIAAGRHV